MGLTLVPLLLVAAGATVAVERNLDHINGVIEEASKELTVILRLQVLLERANAAVQGCASTPDHVDHACDAFRAARDSVSSAFETAGRAPFGLREERELVGAARSQWQSAREIGDQLLVGGQSHPIVPADVIAVQSHIDRAIALLERAHALGESEMSASLTSVRGTRRTTLLLIVAMFALGAIIAGTAATMMARSVLQPVTALERGAERVAAGNLAYRVAPSKYAELARLGRTFNAMADALSRSHASLLNASVRDGLTDVYNHRQFKRCLSVEVERWRRSGQPFDLLLLDIDGFKRINDTCGHQAGDEVLRRVAMLLSEAVRPTDMVARYGGDEFVILLPRTSDDAVPAIAERVRSLIATALQNSAPLPTITASIGFAGCPEDAESEEDLVRQADRALYDAKRMGGNQARAAANSRA